jgi:hypothetical protein
LTLRSVNAFIQTSQLFQGLISGAEEHVDTVRNYNFDGGAEVPRPELLYPERMRDGYSIGCESLGDSNWEIIEECSKHSHTRLSFQAGLDKAFERARIATKYAPIVQGPLDSTPKMWPSRQLDKVRLVFVPNRSKKLATHCFERIAGGPRTLEPAKKDLVNVDKLVFDDRLHFNARTIGPRYGKQD